jgi:hypothetical protein
LVNFQKWVVIAAALVGLGLFTQEAAATGLTGTLQRTGMAGSTIGGGLAAIGRGGGAAFSGLLQPFWEIRNIIRGFMNLGSATPWLDDTPNQGGGTTSTTGDGGGAEPVPVSIIQGIPDKYTGGGFTYYSNPNISPHPVTNVTVHGQELPLSAEAVKFYESVGAVVSATGGGTNSTTGGGGGSSSPLAAAHAAGYSLGSA